MASTSRARVVRASAGRLRAIESIASSDSAGQYLLSIAVSVGIRRACLGSRQRQKFRDFVGETGISRRTLCPNRTEQNMDNDTRHEIVVLTLSTIAALPVVTGIGLAVVAGLLAW